MLILLICGVLGYAIAVYVLNGLIMWYIGWFFLIIGFFTVVTLCLRKTHHLHMHHYTIGMILIVMFGYQSVTAAVIQGYCNGMMIEGGSRWGYDPIWIRNDPHNEAPLDEEQDVESDAQSKGRRTDVNGLE